MKRLLLFLLVAAVYAVTSFAQTLPLGKGIFAGQYTGSALDSITPADSTWNLPITPDLSNGYSYIYDVKVKLKKISGLGLVRAVLQAKKFADDSYTNISVVTYTVTTTSVDTSLYWTTSTANQYNYYNLKLYHPTSTQKVYPQYVKTYFKH